MHLPNKDHIFLDRTSKNILGQGPHDRFVFLNVSIKCFKNIPQVSLFSKIPFENSLSTSSSHRCELVNGHQCHIGTKEGDHRWFQINYSTNKLSHPCTYCMHVNYIRHTAHSICIRTINSDWRYIYTIMTIITMCKNIF